MRPALFSHVCQSNQPTQFQVGTAALLNVPASLEKVLKEMKARGYDLGEAGGGVDGEALVAALKVSSRASHGNVRRRWVVRTIGGSAYDGRGEYGTQA